MHECLTLTHQVGLFVKDFWVSSIDDVCNKLGLVIHFHLGFLLLLLVDCSNDAELAHEVVALPELL